VPADRTIVPLVPRRRLSGLAFGAVESIRRGRGFDVAGSRAYQPGDPVEAIDWKTSARLSTAVASDVFVVRERYAEEAPRAVIACDRRPALGIEPAGLPLLSKPAAIRQIVDLIARSVAGAHGLLGYLDLASSDAREGAFWRPPRGRASADEILARAADDAWDAREGLSAALERLVRVRGDLPAGSFVFLVSDFLDPPGPDVWERVLARRWEVVPVIVQDPVWEQDFPAIASVVTPLLDPASGRVELVRLSEAEVEARRESNRARLALLLAGLESLELNPVLVSDESPDAVLEAFLDWDAERAFLRGRLW
jgi:uncharacterized protein (DUF58 family)